MKLAEQWRTVEDLRPCQGRGCVERNKQEQILRSLIAEVRRRCDRELDAFWLTAHLAAFQAAEISADVFYFRVPPSHRAKIGPYVSMAKRAFVHGLQPFHLELLRRQRNFNLRLLEVLRPIVATRAIVPATAFVSDLKKGLAQLADPRAWEPVSHRGPGLGTAIRMAKKTYMGIALRWLSEVMEQQRRWNLTALEALEASCTRDQSSDRARALVDKLSSEAEVVARYRHRRLGISTPLWREVFRRQIDFNQALSAVIAELLGAQLPAPRPHAGLSYHAWVSDREGPEISKATVAILDLQQPPRFSVIITGGQSANALPSACVASVKAQIYPHWELCKAGAAKGDFVVFVDSTHSLAPHALAELALWIHSHPEVDVLYCDEDEIDEQGHRTQPFFKPDWSPDLLRTVNYVGNFLVVRQSLLQAVGSVRSSFEEGHFLDLVLRVTEQSQSVGHIPRVLHHRRQQPPLPLGEGRGEGNELQAIAEHLRRSGEASKIEATPSKTYRVKYPVRGNPLVSIIVPFKDRPELLSKLINTLIPLTRYQEYELLLISNNSVKEETLRLLEQLDDPRIRKLTWDHPFNYSSINNFGAEQARGAFLLFLNNDIEVCQPDWLEELLGHAQRPQIGAVGPKLLYPNGNIQHAGVVLGINGFAGHVFCGLPESFASTPFGHADWVRNYSAVTGACLMVRKEIFEGVNGFDEHFELCGGDIDLCLRIGRSGKRTLYTPHAKLIHHEGASRRLTPVPFNDSWMSLLAYQPWLRDGDPFYNPNLTLLNVDGSLREHKLNGEDLAMGALATQLGDSDRLAHVHRRRHLSEHLSALDAPVTQPSPAHSPRKQLRTILWFLTPSSQYQYGELESILRLGDGLQQTFGVESRYLICDEGLFTPPADASREDSDSRLGARRCARISAKRESDFLEGIDLAIATGWDTAYAVIRVCSELPKLYYVPDFEPHVYAAGSEYALAEHTYRLGIPGIFSDRGVFEYLQARYPIRGSCFEFFSSPHPNPLPEGEGTLSPRCFYYSASADLELGLSALTALRGRERSLDIVIGAESFHSTRRTRDAGFEVLPVSEMMAKTRPGDFGLCVFSSIRVPVVMREWMAWGLSVVSQRRPETEWLLAHERNCLLSEPTPTALCEQLYRLIQDVGLRKAIAGEAARMGSNHSQESISDVHAYLRRIAIGANNATH